MRRLALLAILPFAAAAAPAHAATWSAPVTLSQTPHTFAGPPAVGAGATGSAIVAWPWQDGVGASAAGGASFAGRGPRGAAFGPERPAPAGLLDVATFADTRVLALAQRLAGGVGAAGAQRQRLAVAFGATTGALGAARTLTVAPILSRPVLAANARGQALVAWIEVTRTAAGATRRIVRVAERPAGGGFGALGTLSGTGHADAVAAAVAGNGDRVVVIARDGRVLARVRRHGRGWGAWAELTRARTGTATRFVLQAAADPSGRLRLVWRRHQFRTSDLPARRSLEGTFLPLGRSRFRPVQVIEADGVREFALRPAGASWALAEVRDAASGPQPAARLAGASATFGPALAAAPGQGGVRGVDAAFDATTGLTVAWIQPIAGQDGDGQARAAVLAPGATAFGPAEAVSPPEAVHEVRLAGDGPLAAWTARPDGTGPGIPLARIRTVVRSAVRVP
jgi:hypothetical protein